MDGQATPVTWKVILNVVRGPLVQNKAVAMEIYQSLKHQDVKQQNTSGKYYCDFHYYIVNLINILIQECL